jgi:hypothetical protein
MIARGLLLRANPFPLVFLLLGIATILSGAFAGVKLTAAWSPAEEADHRQGR